MLQLVEVEVDGVVVVVVVVVVVLKQLFSVRPLAKTLQTEPMPVGAQHTFGQKRQTATVHTLHAIFQRLFTPGGP